MFKKDKILQVNELYKYQCSKIMYKKLQNRLHHYHSSKLIMNFDRQTITTRQKYDVYIDTRANALTRINAFCFKISNCWNELPIDVKMLAFKTLPTYAKGIKRFYLSNYSDICNKNDCYISK